MRQLERPHDRGTSTLIGAVWREPFCDLDETSILNTKDVP